MLIGYEPAGLTMHLPPIQKNRSMVDSFFSHVCLVSGNIFPEKKLDFVGGIKS